MLLTIDSGADLGWALFDPHTRLLAQCGFRNYPKTFIQPLTRLVIEKPHTGNTGARKKDVITLAVRAGEVGGLLRYLTKVEPEYITPNAWKGSTPKKISVERTRAKLCMRELSVLELNCGKLSLTKEHNVLDAIGIGLYALKR